MSHKVELYIDPNTNKLIYGFIRKYKVLFKSLNIPDVIIKLFMLYFYQRDFFHNIIGRNGFIVHNHNLTAMRNDIDENSFKQIYGKTITEPSSYKQKVIHLWRIKVNNVPFLQSYQQLHFGISSVETGWKHLHYYYSINNKLNHIYNSKNNIEIQHLNINHFQTKEIMKNDIITIELVLDYNHINLHFYINDVHCTTYKNIDNIKYKLFISTNKLFVSVNLESYECKISKSII